MSAAVGGVVQQAVLVTLVLPVSLARDTPPSLSCSLSLLPGTHLGLRGWTARDGRHHVTPSARDGRHLVTPSAADRENTW